MDVTPPNDASAKLLDDDDLESRIASMRERSEAAMAAGNGAGAKQAGRAPRSTPIRNRRESWEIPRVKEVRRRWCSCAPASLGRWAVLLGYAGAIAAITCVLVYSAKTGWSKHYTAWATSGAFVTLTVPLSVYDIYLHLRHYRVPRLQRWIVRVMFMVPIYSVEAFLSLRFIKQQLYWNVMREAYEAYAIFCFTHFLLAYLGHDEAAVVALLEAKKPTAHAHTVPLKWCLKPWPQGKRWLQRVKIGVLQYVVVRLCFSIITFILELCHCDVYHTDAATGKRVLKDDHSCFQEGNFSPKYGYAWATIWNNFSQMWAIYCLVLLYHTCKDDMAAISPFRKFCCIKFVVFFSFWQAVGIAALVHFKWLKADPSWTNWTTENIAAGLQSWLVTLEMLIAAALHHCAFSYKEWLTYEDAHHGVSPRHRRAGNNSINSAESFDGPAAGSPAAGPADAADEHMSLGRALYDSAVPHDVVRAAGGTLSSLGKGLARKMGMRSGSRAGDGDGDGSDDGRNTEFSLPAVGGGGDDYHALDSVANRSGSYGSIEGAAAQKTGWMLKKGKLGMSGFKKRWFVLTGTTLQYFERPGAASPRGTIAVADILGAAALADGTWKEPGLRVDTKQGRAFLFKCPGGAAERNAWVAALEGTQIVLN